MPAYRLVAEAIEREIVAGRIRPGEPIGTEAELMKQLGVQRSTVREGIRLLEQGGMIERSSGRRLIACLPRYTQLASRMSRALVLHEVTFRELWQTALVLEVAGAEQAAEHPTPELIAALEDNIARTERARREPAAVANLDTEFHALLAKGSRNRVLELAREPGSLLFFQTVEMVVSKVAEGTPRLIEAHRQLLDAVRRGDKAAARLWMTRHSNDWRRGFERAGNALDEPVDRIYAEHITDGRRQTA